MVSLHLTHKGHEDAYERLNALRHGLLPCPPCAISSPPLRQSIWSALPTSPPHTVRFSALSKTAAVAPMAIASINALTVRNHTASIIPVATGTVPSASSIKP